MEPSANKKRLTKARNELRFMRLGQQRAIYKVNDPVDFKTLCEKKRSKIHVNLALQKVGKRKLLDLLNAGIKSAKALLEYPGVPDQFSGGRGKARLFESWRKMADEHFAKLK